ncbi:hypothetical protein [Mycoplasmopsis caviae]|nr:hypothetical protein [Mycoplasmopsis caviae]VDR42322.1 Uncharacterised protein [Mycoplasmopsis caviae]
MLILKNKHENDGKYKVNTEEYEKTLKYFLINSGIDLIVWIAFISIVSSIENNLIKLDKIANKNYHDLIAMFLNTSFIIFGYTIVVGQLIWPIFKHIVKNAT